MTAVGLTETVAANSPEKKLSICSFTCFVGVCLSDQSKEGRGNLTVLKGAHHGVQEFFRWQAQQGGTLGPEGPGWDRVMFNERTGKWVAAPSGAIAYAMAHDARLREGAFEAPDGQLHPRPTQVKMRPGDAVFVMHALPHSGSLNSWEQPRQNIYFRLVNERRMAAFRDNPVTGRSDHMIRGWDGEFLEPKEGLPHSALYESSMASLLDHWSEWEGMVAVVAEGRRRKEATAGAQAAKL